jgi:hypothetical protein
MAIVTRDITRDFEPFGKSIALHTDAIVAEWRPCRRSSASISRRSEPGPSAEIDQIPPLR